MMERLSCHFEPERGWMNDPNGLIFFRGKLHAFYQHNPYAAHWGPMHWGHAVSGDFLHWENLPIALRPEEPYENYGGCFSGSALEKDDKLYLMYTSVSKELGQTQSMAVSEDGVSFRKLAQNPVIRRCPVDDENMNFRDPKIFAYGNEYRMVCGAGAEGTACVLLYGSKDLISWEYMGKIFESADFGPVPECPDFFPLGDKWVLMFSRMDEGNLTQFIIGDFDGSTFKPECFQNPERGPDFYAAQSFIDDRDRRIIIAWMSSWRRKIPEDAVRAGALSIPREVKLIDGKIHTFPVSEAWDLLKTEDPCVSRKGGRLVITDGKRELLSLPGDAEVSILPDGDSREVFINRGEISTTFYMENCSKTAK